MDRNEPDKRRKDGLGTNQNYIDILRSNSASNTARTIMEELYRILDVISKRFQKNKNTFRKAKNLLGRPKRHPN